MKITQEGPNDCQTVLTIEMELEDMEKYLDRAYKRLVNRMKVPGFRRGKAPRGILERLIGREALVSEALESLVSGATNEAILSEKLEISAQPQVEILEMDPTILKAIVPLEPVVDLGDYGAVRIPYPDVQVTDDDVKKTLEDIRKDIAPWEPVDRSIILGDLVVIDAFCSKDGQTVFDQKDANYIVDQNTSPLPGFADQLQGLNNGESKEFSLEIPSDYGDQNLAGSVCQIKIEIKEIKEQRLLELDDEFARGVGEGYDSIDALSEDVRKQLKASLDDQEKRKYEEEAVERLIESASIQLPPLLIDREVEHLIEDQHNQAQNRSANPMAIDDYIDSLGKSQEQLQEELRPRASQRLNRMAVLNRLADQENVEISESMVDAEVDRMVLQTGQQNKEVQRFFRDPRQREMFTRGLKTRATVEKLAAIFRGEAGKESVNNDEGPAEAGQS